MDIDAIKSKLATLQSTSNTKDNFWKPEPGKQVVRIVPYKHNKDNPFIELFFHYNLGNNKTYFIYLYNIYQKSHISQAFFLIIFNFFYFEYTCIDFIQSF